MKRAKRWVVAGVFLASSADAQVTPPAPEKIAVGDATIAPTLETRVRGVLRYDPPDMGGLDPNGNASPRVRDAWAAEERTRLGALFERGPIRAQLTLQDARVAGAVAPDGRLVERARGFASFGAYEAYLEARTATAKPSYFRLGRQAVSWGEGRLVGTSDWSPTGRAIDAARARYQRKDFAAELLGAILESPRPLGVAYSDSQALQSSGAELFGVLLSYAFAPFLEIEATGLARISRNRSDAFDGSRFSLARSRGETYTASVRAWGEVGALRYGAEGAYQRGIARAMGDRDVDAHAGFVRLGYRFHDAWLSPDLELTGDYASGDEGGSKYTQFDPLLADVHTMGMLDVFAWSNHIGTSARARFEPASTLSINAEYRYARLARAQGEWIGSYLTSLGPGGSTTATGAAHVPGGTELGHEVDATLVYRPWPMLDVAAGYGALVFGDGARDVLAAMQRGLPQTSGATKPGNIGQFAHLTVTARLP